MHFGLSIIIIASNAERVLACTLQALKGISDDIIVLENGSTDNTVGIALKQGARVVNCDWLGYGDTKNIGHAQAKYDWILSLDADEVIDKELKNSILQIAETPQNQLYIIKRYMMWNHTMLHFGGSVENKIRIFNKNFARWDSSEVHEQLLYNGEAHQTILKGKLLHYSYENIQDAKIRNEKYAKADAIKKFNAGIKYMLWIPKTRGVIEFIKIFILNLGFLDGNNGWQYASNKQYYKYKKYQNLKKKYEIS